jgi:hypothetical protein
VLVCAGSLLSCGPLEQQAVPISLGIRLGGTAQPRQLQQSIAQLQRLGTRRLQVELLIEPDSSGLPIISPPSLQEWARIKPLLRERQLLITLSFTGHTDAPQNLWGQWLHSRRGQWFAQYTAELVAFLREQKDLKLERVVVANHFDNISSYSYQPEWIQLITQVRATVAARVTYAANSLEANRFPAWAACDEIGINYVNTETDNQKVLAQERNAQIRSLAEKYQKPVYLAQANLIGPNKLSKLKNRLRFYKDQPLSGLCLNHIQPHTVLQDTTRLWQLDDATLQYLHHYMHP